MKRAERTDELPMSTARTSGFAIARRLHAAAELRAQCGSTPKLRGQRFDRAQGGWTDVVLHSFDVMINHALIESEHLQEVGQQRGPAHDVAREGFPCRG